MKKAISKYSVGHGHGFFNFADGIAGGGLRLRKPSERSIVYNGGQELSYLMINGRVRTLIYTYYNYVNAKEKLKRFPAILRQSQYYRCAANG